MLQKERQRAILIGGGIAGKLAARVLSDFFQEVLIIERDAEFTEHSPRKGVPQGNHVHALLNAGEFGLETLYPGITDKLLKSGAEQIDATKDLAWFHHGVWKLRFGGEFQTMLQSRPHLEWHIEQYTKEIPNITFIYNTTVEEFLYNKEENRVYGVGIKNSDSSRKTLTGDLVVDTSGISSISSKWLKEIGYVIQEEKVHIGLTYVSKFYSLPKKERDWTIKLVYPNPPHETIGGTISKVEGNRYLITLMGYQDEIQEKTVLASESGFLDLSKRLPLQDIHNELEVGTALSKNHIYRIPNIIWKRIDKACHLPNGLLLLGDTVCRIDPVFGQGMTISVLEALALQKEFRLGSNSKLQQIIASFHKKESQIIKPVWNMVVSEDFRYPGVKGKKPFGLPAQQWYVKQIFHLSSHNKQIYKTFLKVMNLLQPATVLFHPVIIWNVLRQGFKRL